MQVKFLVNLKTATHSNFYKVLSSVDVSTWNLCAAVYPQHISILRNIAHSISVQNLVLDFHHFHVVLTYPVRWFYFLMP